eukprot:XP_011676635.1 PREDICTED: uncharacterized protein LOC100888545 isoform X2 [Strongylocentrotus purpuratus]
MLHAMDGIPDKTLLAIAKAISNNEKLLALVLELDFSYADFVNFKETNHSGGEVTSSGTISMIFTWREGTRREDQVRVLSKALEKVGLVEVVEDYLLDKVPDVDGSAQLSGERDSASNQAEPVRRSKGNRINQYVSQEQLNKISREFPNANFESFSLKLGIGANQANNILVKHCKDYRKALMDILMTWKNRTSGPCRDLEDYLSVSGAEDLIADILYR